MNYDDKYKGIKNGEKTEDNKLILSHQEGHCWHCGIVTSWISLEYNARICSEECNVEIEKKQGGSYTNQDGNDAS